jgi:iron complex transport system ATP-binding protein
MSVLSGAVAASIAFQRMEAHASWARRRVGVVSEALVTAEALHFSYRGPPVVAGVSLEVRSGEVVALLGANGCGKSTLLRLLLGLLSPSKGEVRLAGTALHNWSRPEIARHVAYVPQSHSTPFPYLVRDVVALGCIARRGLFGRLDRSDEELVDASMERLGICHLADRRTTELSGGERQLCLIARALAQQAPLIIMDEPFAGLDYGNQWRLLALTRALAGEGRAIVQTSHHPEHVLAVASRAVLLHEGRVVDDGPPKDVITPARVRRLYSLDVERHEVPGGALVLVPSAMEPLRSQR